MENGFLEQLGTKKIWQMTVESGCHGVRWVKKEWVLTGIGQSGEHKTKQAKIPKIAVGARHDVEDLTDLCKPCYFSS